MYPFANHFYCDVTFQAKVTSSVMCFVIRCDDLAAAVQAERGRCEELHSALERETSLVRHARMELESERKMTSEAREHERATVADLQAILGE